MDKIMAVIHFLDSIGIPIVCVLIVYLYIKFDFVKNFDKMIMEWFERKEGAGRNDNDKPA
jgi:hypothetical protein